MKPEDERCSATIRGKQGTTDYDLRCDLRQNHEHTQHVHHAMFDTLVGDRRFTATDRIEWDR